MISAIKHFHPRLRPGNRLQWEEAQSCHVLLYPEGMVKLNQSAANILMLCNGKHSVKCLVEDLEAKFNYTNLEEDIFSFLQIAHDKNWICFDSP